MAARRKTPMVVQDSSSSDEDSDQSDIEETPKQQKSIDAVQEKPDDQSEDDEYEEVEEEVEEEEEEEAEEEVEDEEENEEEEEEEVEDEEEEEEEVEDEEVDEKSPVKHSTITTPAPADSESGSESDSPSPKASDFTVKPVAPLPAKPESKPEKKETKSEQSSEVKAKKGPFVKLWNSDDEITVLEGMVDHQSEKGPITFSDMGSIFESIQGSLHGEFTKNQFCEKVRRLKKKYHANVGKLPKGEDPVFANAEEGKLFKLSKTLWGTNNDKKVAMNNVSTNNSNKRKAKDLGNVVESVLALPIPDASAKKPSLPENWGVKREKKARDEPIGASSYPILDEVMESGKCLDLEAPMIMRGDLMKRTVGSIQGSKVSEWEKKWKELMIDEAELYLKKSKLIEEQTRLICDAMKRNPGPSAAVPSTP